MVNFARLVVLHGQVNWDFSILFSKWVELGPWFNYRWIGDVETHVFLYRTFLYDVTSF